MDETQFAKMIREIRNAEMSLGTVNYDMQVEKDKNIKILRSLFVVENIKKGETITGENVRSIRPGFGLEPVYYDKVMGMVARKDIVRGTPLSFDLLESDDNA